MRRGLSGARPEMKDFNWIQYCYDCAILIRFELFLLGINIMCLPV